jgi:spore coat protein CotH
MRRFAFFVLATLLTAAPAAWAQTAAELFDDSRLHTLEMVIHTRDWADLREKFDQDDHYPADIVWNGVRVRNVGVRSRGLGSRSSEKPGMELEFDYYAANRQFVGLRSLVLDNLVTDASMLREVAATSFLRRVGVPAPRESFARLFVNGEYIGLYALVEAVNRDFAQSAFGQSGMLFEFRWTQPFYENYLGDALDPYASLFASRNPPPQNMTALYAPIRDMFRAVNETPDGEFAAVDQHLDINGFIRLVAADAFLAELDGVLGYDGMNNVYLYTIGARAHVIPWDKDHTFISATHPVLAYSQDHVLMSRLLADPGLRTVFFDALAGMAASGASDAWLETTFSRLYEVVRDAAYADPRKPFTNEAFDQAVAGLVSFARTRPSFVLSEAAKLR